MEHKFNFDYPYGYHNGHEFVEIGGVKWATINIGAKNRFDGGKFFAWGETDGFTAEEVHKGEHVFSPNDYRFYNTNRITKYNKLDKLTTLQLEDDAAHANWGGDWRMPTEEEFRALHAATINGWAENYMGSGVNGYLFIDKTNTSNVLFFPAAGYCYDGSVSYVGSVGRYWSSSLDTSCVAGGCHLRFDCGFCYRYSDNRRGGSAVRGVVG